MSTARICAAGQQGDAARASGQDLRRRAPNLATAAVVVPQESFVIESISRARDGLYLKIMDGGISRLQKHSRVMAGSPTSPLPFDGTIGAVYAVADLDGVLISSLDRVGSHRPGSIRSTPAAASPIPASRRSPRSMSAAMRPESDSSQPAKDSTEIPYTIIYRKGLKLDGRAPTWISAYGSYGLAAYTPAFAGRTLALVDSGAIVGYANVRGGGEYGREWHKAGQLAKKPNTWHDLIAVCEDLVAKKYTSPRHLAIGGRSAREALPSGRAMTERPDLFAAVVDGVGWSNPLRYVVEQNGYGEEPEWGAPSSDPEGYRALKSIDSYQSVKDGTPYPAVLLTTGVTDPRVAPFHVAKMAARLQAATSSGKPILLRVDFDAGHGFGSDSALATARTARPPIPTRSCCGSCAAKSSARAGAGVTHVNRAFLHHEYRMFRDVHVGERIAGDRNDIRRFARRQRAGLIGLTL